MKGWNGRPLSRAKNHIMRDAVARKPIIADQIRATTMETIAVAPTLESTHHKTLE